MDILAHALWAGAGTGLAARRRPLKKRTVMLTVALAAVPDIFHLLPIIGWWLFGDGTFATLRAYAMAVPGQEPPLPPDVQLLSHHLHCVAHSAIVAGGATLLMWLALRSLWVPFGKYTVVQDAEGKLTALRHGEPWRDCCGDGLIHALASEVENLREKLAAAAKAIADSSAAGTTKAGKIRLSLDITPAAKDKLEELVRKSGATTMLETVRKMFALYEMVIDLQKAGGKVVLESSAGLREVLRLL